MCPTRETIMWTEYKTFQESTHMPQQHKHVSVQHNIHTSHVRQLRYGNTATCCTLAVNYSLHCCCLRKSWSALHTPKSPFKGFFLENLVGKVHSSWRDHGEHAHTHSIGHQTLYLCGWITSLYMGSICLRVAISVSHCWGKHTNLAVWEIPLSWTFTALKKCCFFPAPAPCQRHFLHLGPEKLWFCFR